MEQKMKRTTKKKSTIFSSSPIQVLVVVAVCLFFYNATAATAQTETVLYNFTGGADGGYPASPLVLDGLGNVYGTTVFGGSFPPQCSAAGCGVVFEVSPAGTETILQTFSWADGAAPNALIRDAAGNLYSTAQVGGAVNAGAVWALTPSGTERVLYDFPQVADGAFPRAGLVRDTKGNFYGTTEQGGYFGGSCSNGGCGTVFKVTPAGTGTVLFSFVGPPSANYPTAGLILDAQGNLYGTTASGGVYGYGTVYQVTPAGVSTVLYSFAGQPDGAYPFGALLRDAHGDLYGTTAAGGTGTAAACGGGCGTVFELSSSGRYRVLYSFKGVPDGSNPAAGLIQDSEGNLYGTTELGGNPANFSGSGTVFKLTPAGNEKVLYTFTGGADGAYPLAALVMDKQGNLYGTTEEGGASGFGSLGYGTVFKLVP